MATDGQRMDFEFKRDENKLHRERKDDVLNNLQVKNNFIMIIMPKGTVALQPSGISL